jgi:hypothetical protein
MIEVVIKQIFNRELFSDNDLNLLLYYKFKNFK